MKRKFLAGLLSLCLMFSLFPTAVFAEDTTVTNATDLQAALDKAKTGDTIRIAGNIDQVVYVRPTATNETTMTCETHSFTTTDAEAFKAHLNDGQWHTTPKYTTTFKDVTIVGAEGVTVAGFVATSGHAYGNEENSVHDYVCDIDRNGSAYYGTLNITNLKFEGVNFTGTVNINTSDATSVYDGVVFEDCSFTTGGTASNNGPAIRYYNEANKGNVKNITVNKCKFYNCYQGVYTHHVSGVKVTNCIFDTLGHNAVALQGHDGAVDFGEVVITDNNFNNIADRVIRFNEVGAESKITIQNNTATNSGDSDGQIMKATSIETGVVTTFLSNDWGGGNVANSEFNESVAKVGDVYYTNLATAIAEANGGTVTLINNIVLAEGVEIPAGTTVTLDLNGKKISRNTEEAATSAAIKNNGTLTIMDSVGGGKITAFAANPDTAAVPYYANNTITNCGVLTIKGGTIENSTGDEARAAYPIDNNSTSRDTILNIEGGTITGRGAIRQYANSTTNKNEVNITGGTVSGKSYALWMQNPGSSDPVATLNISDGNIDKILLSPSANFESSITGGNVKEVAIWEADTTNPSRNPSAFITGGTFSVNPHTYVPAYCEVVEKDSMYVVGTHNPQPVEGTAATCTEAGTKAHEKCDFCGRVSVNGEIVEASTLVIAALTHNWDEGKVTISPTCAEKGVKTFTCKNDSKHTYTEDVAATGAHTPVKDAAVAAGCGTTGLTEGSHCGVCNATIVAQTTVAATGKHNFGGWERVTNPTCTEKGQDKHTCGTCGHVEFCSVAVTGHSYGADGKCTACGNYDASKVVATPAPTVAPTQAPAATTAPTATPAPEATPQATQAPAMPAEADTTVTEVVATEEVVTAATETVVVSEGTATVDAAAVEKIVEATAEEATVVVIPVAQVTEEVVNKVEVDTEALTTVAEAEKDVVIELTDITVKLDAEAVKAVTEQAGGKTIEIRAVKAETHTLTETQQAAIADKDTAIVVTAQIFSDGEYIGDFKGGKATIKLPFTPEEGKAGEDHSVYFIDDNGEVTKVPSEYVDGHMVFTTSHFSDYAIVYEGAALGGETETVVPEAPAAESSFPIIPIVVVIAIIVVGGVVLMMKKRNAED